MSTPEMNYSAWMEAQNSVAASAAWSRLKNETKTEPAQDEAPPPSPEAAAQPAPDPPDDFWQGWFGIWR
jgi:hypothetical protein